MLSIYSMYLLHQNQSSFSPWMHFLQGKPSNAICEFLMYVNQPFKFNTNLVQFRLFILFGNSADVLYFWWPRGLCVFLLWNFWFSRLFPIISHVKSEILPSRNQNNIKNTVVSIIWSGLLRFALHSDSLAKGALPHTSNRNAGGCTTDVVQLQGCAAGRRMRWEDFAGFAICGRSL